MYRVEEGAPTPDVGTIVLPMRVIMPLLDTSMSFSMMNSLNGLDKPRDPAMPTTTNPTQPRPSPLREIDLVADRFEEQWRPGNPPPISAALDEVPAELRLRLLVELVCIDLEHRLRNNLPITLADYLREFPELESLPPQDRADLETCARTTCDALSRTVDHAPATIEPEPDVPESIGRFRIAGPLGAGAQAEVFLVFHPELRAPVVVKWHRAGLGPDAGRPESLIREGQILAGLRAHPNLLRIYEIGVHDDRPFLVLEHVMGHTLDRYAEGERPTPRQSAQWVAALAEAVHSAHEQGVVHQDINPRNVLIDGRGQPRLIDFGLAWFRPPWTGITEQPPEGGTPRYLAPEQADPRLGPVGPRTDVYALGGVLYFLLTGKPLYDGSTLTEVLRQAANAAYDATALRQGGIPKRLAAVCLEALAQSPEARFATAANLAAALRKATAPRPRWYLVATLTAVVFAAVAVGWLLGQPRSASEPLVETDQPALVVSVWRQQSNSTSLRESLPVRTGDELQVKIQVPAGLHVSLCSINGDGRLSLLQQYSAQDSPSELIYPGSDQARRLKGPAGTEVLLVCGRARTPISEAELQTAWDGTAEWPVLAPPRRLLRLQPGQLKEEGERPRDFGEVVDRPDPDKVARRLNDLRERLKQTCAYFEGLAFANE
jgi:eukaryotic-like serine/threonine-protein kinase